MGKPVVLIVDDEPDICELLAITLEGMEIASRTAHDLGQAKRELSNGELDLCLTDMRLPDGDGLDLVDLDADTRRRSGGGDHGARATSESAAGAQPRRLRLPCRSLSTCRRCDAS
jgi:CheY-like chemotaxis protein